MSNLDHINARTRDIVIGSKKIEKGKNRKQFLLNWVKKNHFVYHGQAIKALNKMKEKFDLISPYIDEIPSDQNGLTIIGHSGCGKTMIVKEFIKRMNSINRPEEMKTKVAYSLLNDNITGLTGVYSSIFDGIGHPYGNYGLIKEKRVNIAALQSALKIVLQRSNYRIFILDEFQHAGTMKQFKQSLINQLKKTMLEVSIPFFPVGTPETIEILSSDRSGQLIDRCRVSKDTILDYWSYDNNFKDFVNRFEEFLPFDENSNLSNQSKLIYDKVKYPNFGDLDHGLLQIQYRMIGSEREGKTNLRRLVEFLKIITIKSIQNGDSYIKEETINETYL